MVLCTSVPSLIVRNANTTKFLSLHLSARRRWLPISTRKTTPLSEHCNFGAALNDMLRDRLVCGIADQRIQRRLLAELDLTFAKATEAADRNTRALDRGPQSIQIHNIGRKVERSQEHARQGGRARQLLCYRCRGKHQQQCNFRNSNCHYYGKKGHIAKVCRNKQRGGSTTKAK